MQTFLDRPIAVAVYTDGVREKNDAADARAIYMTTQQPEVKAVAVKSEGQQAVLAMHRIRQQLVKMRTAQINGLRGLLTEYGEVFGQGRGTFDAGKKAALERLAERLPAPLIDALRDQWNEVARLDERVARIKASLLAWLRVSLVRSYSASQHGLVSREGHV